MTITIINEFDLFKIMLKMVKNVTAIVTSSSSPETATGTDC